MARLCCIPVRALAKLYSLWIRLGWFAKLFLDSKTIFLPRTENANYPANLRPIFIASAFLRQFHKILTGRLINIILVSEQQFGFRSMDGIARFIAQLDSIFHNFKTSHNSCFAVFIDLRMTFDVISFDIICMALQHFGVSQSFINYSWFVYGNACTFLLYNGMFFRSLMPKRKFIKVTLLSFILFLIVFTLIFRLSVIALGQSCGVCFWLNLFCLNLLHFILWRFFYFWLASPDAFKSCWIFFFIF